AGLKRVDLADDAVERCPYDGMVELALSLGNGGLGASVAWRLVHRKIGVVVQLRKNLAGLLLQRDDRRLGALQRAASLIDLGAGDRVLPLQREIAFIGFRIQRNLRLLGSDLPEQRTILRLGAFDILH